MTLRRRVCEQQHKDGQCKHEYAFINLLRLCDSCQCVSRSHFVPHVMQIMQYNDADLRPGLTHTIKNRLLKKKGANQVGQGDIIARIDELAARRWIS